jgi:hypothetical protein
VAQLQREFGGNRTALAEALQEFAGDMLGVGAGAAVAADVESSALLEGIACHADGVADGVLADGKCGIALQEFVQGRKNRHGVFVGGHWRFFSS